VSVTRSELIDDSGNINGKPRDVEVQSAAVKSNLKLDITIITVLICLFQMMHYRPSSLNSVDVPLSNKQKVVLSFCRLHIRLFVFIECYVNCSCLMTYL